MKKILLILALSISLFALDSKDVSNAGFGNLSTQEQANILKLIADKQKDKSAIPDISTAKKAQEWVNLGSSIGKGLASSAKELGIQVNDFSKSSVGKWTMFLIIFQIIGGKVIAIFGGLLFIITGISFTTMILNRSVPWKITYNDEGKMVEKTRESSDSSDLSAFWIGYGAIVLAGCLMIIFGG